MVDKFYKIGEVSKKLNLSPSTLRYWENQFKQLKPVKSAGGQRFYTDKHIHVLEQLKNMLYKERLTIEGAKQRLRDAIANRENINIQNDSKHDYNEATTLVVPYSKEEIKQELKEILVLLQ